MKKFFSLLLAAVITVLSLTSCDFDFSLDDLGSRDSHVKTVAMYGVGVSLNEYTTCIFFGAAGHITMPRLKSGKPSPKFSAGDLIKAVFTTDGGEIAIMESYPGQIGLGADLITVIEDDVDFTITDDGKFFSDTIPDGIHPEVGNKYSFSSNIEGKSKDIAEGVVTEVREGRFTLEMTIYGTDEEFLMYLFEYGVEPTDSN